MRKYTINQDPKAEPLLSVLPFDMPGVKAAIAADLARTGHDSHCGECGKPFTVVRKQRGIARARMVDSEGVLYSTTWRLCGPCTAEMKRNGDKLSPKLRAEAREAAEALRLAITPAGGRA